MKGPSHIGMSQLSGGAGLATKPLARLGVSRVAGADDLERDERPESKVLGQGSYTHRSAAYLVESDSILAAANLIVLEAPALGARLVRPAEEQAVETTQFAGLILKQCAAFLAMQQVVFDWSHWSKVLAEALLSDKNLSKMTHLLVHVVGAPNGVGHFLAQQFGITHAESQKMAAQCSDGH